ncbi:MAG: hypothetical protein F6K62_11400 [Sphaerospermopsis sp. SIO1G2]|nr:hypothetical protein [Sphaerospermopsis sp. SIO1G2]
MDKRTKKKLIRARNQKIQRIQYHIDQHHDAVEDARADEQERIAERLATMREVDAANKADEPWTARTQMIRNRLTNKKRKSMDRWNRFAGTSSGGAMGR